MLGRLKWKWLNFNIFALCIFDGFLNLSCFLCQAYQTVLPYQTFPTGKPEKPGKYYQQKTHNFNNTAACSHNCPLRHPALSLWHWYTVVYLRIFDPGPSNLTTFLGLYPPGDYRQSIESQMGVHTFNSTEKVLKFTICDCILRLWQKRCDFLRNLSLWLRSLFI